MDGLLSDIWENGFLLIVFAIGMWYGVLTHMYGLEDSV